jgi:hypothetical protein
MNGRILSMCGLMLLSWKLNFKKWIYFEIYFFFLYFFWGNSIGFPEVFQILKVFYALMHFWKHTRPYWVHPSIFSIQDLFGLQIIPFIHIRTSWWQLLPHSSSLLQALETAMLIWRIHTMRNRKPTNFIWKSQIYSGLTINAWTYSYSLHVNIYILNHRQILIESLSSSCKPADIEITSEDKTQLMSLWLEQ